MERRMMADLSLSALGGGEGRGEVWEAPAPVRGPTHLTLPVAAATGPLPLPPETGGEGNHLQTEDEVNQRHNEKMARRKAARDRMLATKTEERGLLIVPRGSEERS